VASIGSKIARRASRATVRDDWQTMSNSDGANGLADTTTPPGGILAALPRSRPQRSTPRRAASRRAATANAATAKDPPTGARARKPTGKRGATQTKGKRAESKRPPAPATSVGATSKAKAAKANANTAKANANTAKPTVTAKRAVRRATKPAEPPAPRQGYEPEDEIELGSTVNPPSGAELVESVADIFGELAHAGLTAGGRLLKDAFSLLRRP
jgi:hypothetical protein